MTLQEFLGIEDVNQYKLHAARKNLKGTEPLDVFVRSKKEWHGWNSYRGTKNEFNKPYIISLLDFYPEGNVWLFGGIFKVLERANDRYTVELTENSQEFIGRLKVKLKLPRGRAFKAQTYLNSFEISEILKSEYKGERFPGFENISLNFTLLEQIFNTTPADWRTALQNVKGVYLIADKSNGKKYIGSAYGSDGIWSRWQSYKETGHGGNQKLKELISHHGLKHAREHFKFTLIECWPFKTDDKYIISRESFWKEALITRQKFGYNEN